MRVSRDKLISLARSEAENRADADDILSAYLIGSVASGVPIFGGSADVDVVFIHRNHNLVSREFIPLSKDFHLDIIHHPSELYATPTDLRIDPWLGPSMCEPIFLYDPEHFFERAQAGVRGQYHRADFVHTRAMAFLTRARKLMNDNRPPSNWILAYTQSLLEGANAAATLAGFPAAGRRLAPILHARLLELGQENLYHHFQKLLGADHVEQGQLISWLAEWRLVAEAVSSIDDRFSDFRQTYHAKGFETLITSSDPSAILWNLIIDWNAACLALPHADERRETWHTALQALYLDNQNQEQRKEELEDFFDSVETVIENWAADNGA